MNDETQPQYNTNTLPEPVSSKETQEYEEDMLLAFIQKDDKMDYYQAALDKMTSTGELKFQWVWSWWSFLATWSFLLYRKAYLPALIVFLIALFTPAIGIAIMIIMGGIGPYFIIRRYWQLKQEIEQKYDDPKERLENMREQGGYHYWVVWLMVIFSAFYLIGIVGATLKSLG